jgi:hypothetical protein
METRRRQHRKELPRGVKKASLDSHQKGRLRQDRKLPLAKNAQGKSCEVEGKDDWRMEHEAIPVGKLGHVDLRGRRDGGKVQSGEI